jgi:hypothetical protein
MRPLLILAVLFTGCSKSPPPRRYGDAMTEVGRRFERIGHAAATGRWELADYDAGELEEVFEKDLPRAERPEDVPVDPAPLAAAFAATVLPDLQRAIAARDSAAFAAVYAGAAGECNACHQRVAKDFIEIPTVIGAPVPYLPPVTP